MISFLGVRTDRRIDGQTDGQTDRHCFGIFTWKHVGTQKISTQSSKLVVSRRVSGGRGCIKNYLDIQIQIFVSEYFFTLYRLLIDMGPFYYIYRHPAPSEYLLQVSFICSVFCMAIEHFYEPSTTTAQKVPISPIRSNFYFKIRDFRKYLQWVMHLWVGKRPYFKLYLINRRTTGFRL